MLNKKPKAGLPLEHIIEMKKTEEDNPKKMDAKIYFITFQFNMEKLINSKGKSVKKIPENPQLKSKS